MVGRQEYKPKNRQATNWMCVRQNETVEFKRQQGKKKFVETRNCKDKVEAFVSPNTETTSRPACDVFINHRGIDTKRNIAGLLYDHLSRRGLKPFMDSRNMKPGDKLFDQIDSAIRNCKVAVVVFSPHYCESYHCLRELALLMESKKRVLPIFWNVEPSQLRSPEELRRFGPALDKAKDIVGLAFDSSKGDWSEFLENASKAIENLLDLEGQSMTKRSKSLEQYQLVCAPIVICHHLIVLPTPVAEGWNHAPQKFELFQALEKENASKAIENLLDLEGQSMTKRSKSFEQYRLVCAPFVICHHLIVAYTGGGGMESCPSKI